MARYDIIVLFGNTANTATHGHLYADQKELLRQSLNDLLVTEGLGLITGEFVQYGARYVRLNVNVEDFFANAMMAGVNTFYNAKDTGQAAGLFQVIRYPAGEAYTPPPAPNG